MEVGGKNTAYPGGYLSNFTAHNFIFDDVMCASMEGLLQSFKFKNKDIQKVVCSMVGYAAKRRGAKKNWRRTQTLYWKGVSIKRDSEEYQILLNEAYYALFSQSESFRDALRASGTSVLRHSIGKNKIQDTVLTEQEFCSRLTKLRALL